MDEQRCELPKPIEKSKSTEDMLDMVERVQGDRMNEQRSDLPADDDPSLISTYYMSGRDIILGNLSSDDGDVKENKKTNSNSTRNQVDKEPLCGCATSKSLFNFV